MTPEALFAPLGLLALVFNVWALIQLGESRASRPVRALWITLILILPLIGFMIWLLAGPRSGPRARF
jgi:hypothetical protein